MIRIYADSTNDLGPELIERYHIRIIPLYVNMGGKTYTDWADITPDEIYDWSDANNTTPTTAAFSIGDAEEAIAEKTGKAVLSSPRFGAAALKEALEAKGLC